MKILFSVVLLIPVSYGVFHFWEYVTGEKYITYITNHKETVSLDESFSFKIAEDDIKKSKLILVGEIHGFKTPTFFDVDFFSYLNKNHGVKHYVAEVDYMQAHLLNQFLKSGDEETLKKALRKWSVIQGRLNKDYFNKFIRIQQFNKQLPKENQIQFIGIDQIQDLTLVTEYLNSLDSISSNGNSDISSLLSKTEALLKVYGNQKDTLKTLYHIKNNLSYLENKIGREEILFQNFKNHYRNDSLQDKKLYGYFGLYHIFQYRVNGNRPLAAKIKNSDLGLDGKILSLNFLMNDSYMVMPSNQLPEFMRTGNVYSKMPISADNLLFMYIYGIKDFTRATDPNTQSLIKMNGDDSPYGSSSRLVKTFQLLPVTDLMEMTDAGKEYVQYTIFVRNSDWAEPMD
tara:strand:+ start:5843 stop:7042 length:1200 start_codon:yes stop_codon:yes gene_type:complete